MGNNKSARDEFIKCTRDEIQMDIIRGNKNKYFDIYEMPVEKVDDK